MTMHAVRPARVGVTGSAPPVLSHGDGLEMSGIDTRSIAAAVVNGQPVKDWTHSNFVGKAVG
jgi:hypothetical protein